MNLYLIGAILVLSLINSDIDKKLMFGSLAVFQGGHYLIASNLSADAWLWYDITGALLLYALSQCFEYDEDHAIYHLILCAGILTNLTDYVFWANNIQLDPALLMYLGLYSYTIIILMSGPDYDRGNRTALSFFDGICRFIDKNNLGCLAKAAGEKS